VAPEALKPSPDPGAEAFLPRLRLSGSRRRIVIYGVTGSGKTTVARRLSAVLGLPAVELDAIMWQRPNWEMIPPEEFRPQVEAAVAAHAEGWVVEGNYASVRDFILSRADTVVWLRYPWRTSFWRVFKRTMRRAWTREVLWGTNRESLRLTFLSKDSLLWWAIHHHRASIRGVEDSLAEVAHQADVLVVRSPRELEDVVKMLAGERESVGPALETKL